VWRPEASPRRIWHRFCTCRTPRTQLRARAGNRGAVQESYARRERAGATCAYNSRSDASEGRGFRMRGRERVAGQRHLEFAAAARCSDPVMPAPQSRDSSPYSSNRSAHLLPLSDKSRWIPSTPPSRSSWFFTYVLTSASLPAPLQQLYHRHTSISSSPVPSLCSGAYAFA